MVSPSENHVGSFCSVYQDVSSKMNIHLIILVQCLTLKCFSKIKTTPVEINNWHKSGNSSGQNPGNLHGHSREGRG